LVDLLSHHVLTTASEDRPGGRTIEWTAHVASVFNRKLNRSPKSYPLPCRLPLARTPTLQNTTSFTAANTAPSCGATVAIATAVIDATAAAAASASTTCVTVAARHAGSVLGLAFTPLDADVGFIPANELVPFER
jgi:hypothetical protein